MAQGQPRAAGAAGETERAELTEHQRQVAIVAGWRALEAGLPETACPYPTKDRRRDVWLVSYRAAQTLASSEPVVSLRRPRGGARRTGRNEAA